MSSTLAIRVFLCKIHLVSQLFFFSDTYYFFKFNCQSRYRRSYFFINDFSFSCACHFLFVRANQVNHSRIKMCVNALFGRVTLAQYSCSLYDESGHLLVCPILQTQKYTPKSTFYTIDKIKLKSQTELKTNPIDTFH